MPHIFTPLIAALLFALAVPIHAGQHIRPGLEMLCDFDSRARGWYSEAGGSRDVLLTQREAFSGRLCLAVRVGRHQKVLRATWGTDIVDLCLSPESRIQFAFRSAFRRPIGHTQLHGGIILVEGGGKRGGGDSHWMLDVPASLWLSRSWTQFTTPRLREASNPQWAPDADGRIDYRRLEQIMFVVQVEDPLSELPDFEVFIDDVAVSYCSFRTPLVSQAANFSVPAAVRPIQRGFVGRERDAGQRVLFSDITGWRVIRFAGTEAEFVRSEEEPLFGQQVGKLTYSAPAGCGYVRLEPPEPPILHEFDSVLTWVFGNNWEWLPDPTTPPVRLELELTDAYEEIHVIQLDRVVWKFWSMMHKLIRSDVRDDERHYAFGGDGNGLLDFPVRLTAIVVRGGTNRSPRSIYLDSVIFRTETPELPEFHADIDDLPFPTTTNTILPSLVTPVRNYVEPVGTGWRFVAAGDDVEIEYLYEPLTGTLSDLVVRAGNKTFRPCDGAGPYVRGVPANATIRGARLGPGGILRTEWRTVGGAGYFLEMRIKGKSLICDWWSADGVFDGFSVGAATGLDDCKLFHVPYLTMGWGTPPAVLWDQGLYCFALLDLHNTNASRFYGGSERVSASRAVINGGSRYVPLTDGSRNPLRERLFITVSRNFEEVLPSIPNPPSPMGELMGRNLYCHVMGTAPDRFARWLEMWKLYKCYGIDHVRLSHHEDAWTDGDTAAQGPQEFTMTLEAAPEIGDEQLIEYCRAVRGLGWLIGLYSNYCDYSMLGKSWDERNVVRHPSGEWKRAWPPTFSLKPLKAVEMQSYYAYEIARKFNTNTVYSDVHTALAPWENTDYQAGTPGAGMLRTQFRSYGALLLNEREAYGGPVISEGIHHWFYAGLTDGNYAQMGLPEPERQPLLLDFALRKIHPLEAGIGMSPWAYWGTSYYHLAAVQIAYGHVGHLQTGSLRDAVRSYYLMQQLQSRYTRVPVEKILYRAADSRMVAISDALPEGANLENQAYVKYRNGLEIYANCNSNKYWCISIGGRELVLPPFGWAAVSDGFLEYSAEFNSRRVDFVDSPSYVYADSGGALFDFGPVQVDGVLVIRRDDLRGLRVIVLESRGPILVRGPRHASVRPLRGDGSVMDLEIRQLETDDGVQFWPLPDVPFYLVAP